MTLDYSYESYAAFDKVVREKEQQLRCAAFNIVGDWDRASDVVQEAYIKGLGALDKFREESTSYTWLYRITVNTALNVMRERGRRHFVDNVDLSALAHEGIDPRDEIAETDEKVYRSRVMAEALAKLSEEQSRTIRLHYFLGQTYETVAETLGVPVGTVKSRIHGGKERLRKILEKTLRAA